MSRSGTIFMAAEDLESGMTVAICDKALAMVYRGAAHHGWAKNKLSTFVVGVTLKAAKAGDLVTVDVGGALSAEREKIPLDSAVVELYKMMFEVEKGGGHGKK